MYRAYKLSIALRRQKLRDIEPTAFEGRVANVLLWHLLYVSK